MCRWVIYVVLGWFGRIKFYGGSSLLYGSCLGFWPDPFLSKSMLPLSWKVCPQLHDGDLGGSQMILASSVVVWVGLNCSKGF